MNTITPPHVVPFWMPKFKAYLGKLFFFIFGPPGPPQKIETKNDEITRKRIISSGMKSWTSLKAHSTRTRPFRASIFSLRQSRDI